MDIEDLSICFCKNQFVREVPLPTLMTLLSVSVPGSVGTATAHSTVLPHNKMKKTREARAKERPLFLLACRGSFNNYVDIIFTFFDRLPTSTWTIFNQNVDKNRCLLTTYPPQSVNVIFEWPWILLIVNCGVSRTINHWVWTFWSSSKSSSFQAFPLEDCEELSYT